MAGIEIEPEYRLPRIFGMPRKHEGPKYNAAKEQNGFQIPHWIRTFGPKSDPRERNQSRKKTSEDS